MIFGLGVEALSNLHLQMKMVIPIAVINASTFNDNKT